MPKRPLIIHHLDHLLQRHKRRVVAALITIIGLIILFIITIVYLPTEQFTAEPTFESVPSEPLGTELASTSEPTIIAQKTGEQQIIPPIPILPNYERVIVESGETLSHIFDRLHLSQQQLYQVSQLPEVKNAAKRLQAGQELEFVIENNQLQKMIVPINGAQDLQVTWVNNQFTAEIVQHQFRISSKLLSATMHTSLYQTGEDEHIPQKILNNFATIFGWQIDFNRDVRSGDQIRILYQEYQNLKNNKIEPGDIIAASYNHNGKTYYAFQYRDQYGRVGYFDENGKSLKKAFRRKPVDIGYISSPFSLHRRNPVLGIIRPHTGTDFAAPYGTPIHATGDGRIIFRGRKGGYGRCIVIDHGNGITTLYGHMSRFNAKFTDGAYVKMGDTIGYIGSSGLSTGPLVHYEYRINHRYQNPMTVVLPNAAPVPASERTQYKDYVAEEMKKLDPSNYNQQD